MTRKTIFLHLQTVVLCLVLHFAWPLAAQNEQHDSHFMCSYYGERIDPKIKMSSPSADAVRVIGRITGVVGLKPNFEVRSANVPNAAAVILNGKRFILYNPNFMASINSASRNNWSGISIMAHEIGHHLNGHTLTGLGSRPDLELEADEFSGFVLNRMGATLSDAQAAMSVAASLKASHTHPAKADRLASIETGWKNAGGQPADVAPATKKAVSKPVIVKNPEKAPAIAEKYIAFEVSFNANPKGTYYITVRGNLVQVEDDSLYLIGRLSESNKKGYKLMLSDKSYNYLYIAQKGTIVNGNGRPVGRITEHQ